MKKFERLIKEITDMREDGNQEIAIFFHPDMHLAWHIKFVNTCRNVMLGKSSGLFESGGETLAEAIDELKRKIKAGETYAFQY